MSNLGDIICKSDIKKLNNLRNYSNFIQGRLWQNLIYRLKHRNLIVKTSKNGKYIDLIKMSIYGKSRWVRPFVENNRLKLEVNDPNWFLKDLVIEASDIFGNSINDITDSRRTNRS